jgi:hypothetical protein
MAIVKVGLVQMSCTADVAANKAKAISKIRETARLDLTRNINSLLERKKNVEGELEEAKHKSKCFDAFMASFHTSKVYAERSAEFKKEIEKWQLALKIVKFCIIIGISLRDKKGTYLQLKSKYSETLDDYMALLETSGDLCEFGNVMKRQYDAYELIYSILK